MKKHKYYTSFAFTPSFAPLNSLKDKESAFANIKNLESALPEYASDSILCIAGNAYVANLCNLNDDCVGTDLAIDIAPTFIDKQINVEHSQYDIKGHIKAYSFSSFSDSTILEQSQVEGSEDPFNVVLAGFFYRSADPFFASMLEMSNDSSSELYKMFSFSFEVGFDDFVIAVGNTNLSKADRIITEAEEIEKYSKYLRAYGGGGFDPQGNKVYRVISGEGVEGLGLGIVTNPAASVSGILVSDKHKKDEEYEESSADITDFQDKTKNKEEKRVNTVNRTFSTTMKLKSLEDIIDNREQITASAVSDFISEKIKEKSGEYETKLADERNLKAALEEKNAELEAKLAENAQAIKDLETQLSALASEKEERQRDDEFNQRMSDLDSSYSLDDDLRKTIATQIRDLSDEEFASWREDFAVFASKFGPKEEVVEDEASLVENLDKAEEPTVAVANSVDFTEKSKAEDFKFNFEIKHS